MMKNVPLSVFPLKSFALYHRSQCQRRFLLHEYDHRYPNHLLDDLLPVHISS